MISGIDFCRSKGINVDKDFIPEQQFIDAKVAMLVRCTGCETSLCILGAFVDGTDHTWCATCAEGK